MNNNKIIWIQSSAGQSIMTTTGKLSDSLLLTCESWQDSYGNNTDFIHSCCRIYPDDTIVERATLISTIDWTQHAGGGTA